ncbi:helix-turn-helix domain-containing protein [Ruminococcus sp. Marseille-P6503]|uniref:helix-turn-helix domain-containing protein n=1 Tax=Ruminococcus sp. Marseille-P6503 TaxID=2364796 RepID=UPI000F523B38|nr:helix-turn-helix domain-containing protein [Ruminococcus sp. Marseille-P6503]
MILPRRIYDLGLSHKAVAVYCYLCNRADKNGECFPSVRRISEDLNINKSTVFRAFNELEEQGLLEREARYHTRGGRRSSLYRIKGEITPKGGGKSTSKKVGGLNV